MDNKTFTDDDLKRWRKELADGFAVKRTPLYRIFGTEMDALLARLEAAEKVIEACGQELNVSKPYEAWRKAAGK